MKTLIKYFAKKYIISLINDSLELAKKKVNISSIKTKVKLSLSPVWIYQVCN